MSDKPAAGDDAAAAAKAAKEARKLQFAQSNPGLLTKAEKDAAKKNKQKQQGAGGAQQQQQQPKQADGNGEDDTTTSSNKQPQQQSESTTGASAAAASVSTASTTSSADNQQQQQQQSKQKKQTAPPTAAAAAPVPQYALPESLAQLRELSQAPPILYSANHPWSSSQSIPMSPPSGAFPSSGSGGDPSSRLTTHPRVAALGTLLASRSIIGGNARLLGTIDALCVAACSFIESHAAGADMRMLQSLSSYLRHNLKFLERCRPFTAGMKQVTDRLMRGLGTHELSVRSLESVFSDLRNDLVGAVIDTAVGAQRMVQDGDIVLTYGRSSAIELALCNLSRAGKVKFSIIIVDAAPLFEGRALLSKLREAGCQRLSYCMLDACVFAANRASKVFIGASALMPSGQVLGRAGTSMVAIAARYCRKPVFCVCESYKFTANMWQGSLTQNQADHGRSGLSGGGGSRSAGAGAGVTPNSASPSRGSAGVFGPAAYHPSMGGGVSGGVGGIGGAAANYRFNNAAGGAASSSSTHNDSSTVLYDLTPPGSVQFVVSEHDVHEPTAIAAVVQLRQS